MNAEGSGFGFRTNSFNILGEVLKEKFAVIGNLRRHLVRYNPPIAFVHGCFAVAI